MNGPNHYNEQTKLLNAIRLPARLRAEQAAIRLGFEPHDIPVLIELKLLSPLGKPARNAVKYFSAAIIEGLASDQTWLAKATNAIYNYWKSQNSRRRLRSAGSELEVAA